MPERGSIVDYKIDESTSGVTLGGRVGLDTVPLLVVTNDDATETYSGFAFLPDGTTHYVTVSPDAPDPSASWAFDPQTGKPIGPAKFDSHTGAPLNADGTPAAPPDATPPPGADTPLAPGLPPTNPASPSFSADADGDFAQNPTPGQPATTPTDAPPTTGSVSA